MYMCSVFSGKTPLGYDWRQLYGALWWEENIVCCLVDFAEWVYSEYPILCSNSLQLIRHPGNPKTYTEFVMPSLTWPDSATAMYSMRSTSIPVSQISTPVTSLATPSNQSATRSKHKWKWNRMRQDIDEMSESEGNVDKQDVRPKKQKRKTPQQGKPNYLEDDGTKKVSSDPSSRKWYDNGVAITA